MSFADGHGEIKLVSHVRKVEVTSTCTFVCNLLEFIVIFAVLVCSELANKIKYGQLSGWVMMIGLSALSLLLIREQRLFVLKQKM